MRQNSSYTEHNLSITAFLSGAQFSLGSAGNWVNNWAEAGELRWGGGKAGLPWTQVVWGEEGAEQIQLTCWVHTSRGWPLREAQLDAHRVKCSPVCSRNKVREKRPFEANLTLEVSIKMRRLDPNHKTLVCKEITIFKINCKTILLVAEVVQKAKKKKRVSCSL